MELKEFIKTALTEIVEGVRLADNELQGDAALCYHADGAYNGYPSITYKSSVHERQAPLTVVGFRVQVQVSNTCSADGNVKAGALNVIGGEINGKAAHASATTQELSFSVPMVWKKR